MEACVTRAAMTVYLYLTPRGEGDGLARERPCVTVGAQGALPVWPHTALAFYLMLGRELLHVGVKTSEARQEVVDHHLLGNDCGREVKAVDAGG